MNKSEFQQKVSESNKPVIVDFWAAWCRPCMMSKPILEKLAKEYADKIEFMPINADNSPEVLEQFRVFGIPTVITLQGGKETGRVTGAQNEENYRVMFEALAEGKELKFPLAQFDRRLRISAGSLFIMVGMITNNWGIVVIGAILFFMGIYDRCPIWKAITGIFNHN